MFQVTGKEIAQVVESLISNGFAPVRFVDTAEDATRAALDLIPLGAKVGIGGSTTIQQIGLVPQLEARGTTVLNLRTGDLIYYEADRKNNRECDVFLASSNAVTLDGKLVNIDGTGNRVSAMIFGPRQVVLIVGVNKIVRDVNEAIDRIKNVTAPHNNKLHRRKVPCASDLCCTDCNSPDRGCRVTVIIEKKPRRTDIAVVLVGEDLGLGWDTDWPQERKDKILAVYSTIPHTSRPPGSDRR